MGVPRKPSTNRSACGQYTVVPGHQGITGNEAADSLADAGAKSDIVDPGPTAQPTISGIRIDSTKPGSQRYKWMVSQKRANVVRGYHKWQLDYALKEPMELKLSRPTLHRLLALRSRHGDFEAYHKRFKHEDAETHCPCGKAKTPEHLVFCEISVRRFHSWPLKPVRPPTTAREGHDYIQRLLALPQEFERFVTTTRYFTFCNREPNGVPNSARPSATPDPPLFPPSPPPSLFPPLLPPSLFTPLPPPSPRFTSEPNLRRDP
ncbi:hypothetical protein DID88_009076 [Monilinia fructigena]|uniref:Uncharacterized protein n=1 Tax=Monilinia fructigena TaxID=38457 RepID=A0A395IHY1_9HELO|nr:hypothetical protein DID88_009076 [Monilinia fructigena]